MQDKKVPQEKVSVQHADVVSSDKASDDGVLLTAENRTSAERNLVRKLDYRLLPTIAVIYIVNYIDRVAVASARLNGLEKDLNLSAIQYSTIIAILFAVYCPAQIPSNMILNHISRPSLYIGSCTVSWGLASLLAGTTKNFGGLMACRVFVGFPEAAFYPGSIYLLSRWYTRKELALRSAVLYSGSIIANAFGSLVAVGILGDMEGKLGIEAWRWLFYIEGAATIFIGFQAMWLLPDYPHNTRWITLAERRLARARLAEDAGEADEDQDNDTPWQGLKMALQDPKVYLFSLFSFCGLLSLGFVNFFPTLAATLGFSNEITLLLAAPPWIVASILCVLNAWHADQMGERFWHISTWWILAIVGHIIALSTMSVGGRYFSLFLLAFGPIASSITLVWVSNSIPRPPSKRAASIGIVNGFGNIGNLTSSFVWKASWGPEYQPSFIIGICSVSAAILLAFIMRTMLKRENHQLDLYEAGALQQARHERVEQAARLEGITLEEAMDKKRGFRYLY